MTQMKLPTPLVMGLALVMLGVVGGILPGMFVALFWSSDAGWRTLLIVAVLLATWFPIKSMTDRMYGKSSPILAGLPRSATLGTLGFVLIASIVLVPVLWMMTGYVIAIALLTYAFSGLWWVGLLTGLLLQGFFSVRGSQAEKASGNNQGAFFVRMDSFGNDSIFMTNLDPERNRSPQSSPYLLMDDRETVITFEDEDVNRSGSSSAPDTITIDRQSE
jgi:hypothetical protein